VAWPLLTGGAAAGSAATAAAFAQVGGLGGSLLAEVVIRVWDRLRSSQGPSAEQQALQEALATEFRRAFTASASELRAEVAGVLQGVDAIGIALTTTIAKTIGESGDQVREMLIAGLRQLGTQFAEFGWLLDEVNDQITYIAETQAEILAGSRAMLEAQQRTLMQLTILRQQAYPAAVAGSELTQLGEATGIAADQKLSAATGAAGVPVAAECPYPGLEPYGVQDAYRFFGREQETAILITQLAQQLTRPGLLMVIGPSGSGKSSLLRAGLIPAIARGALPAGGSHAWPVDLLTPGRRPMLEPRPGS
jgi:hypothetical protein